MAMVSADQEKAHPAAISCYVVGNRSKEEIDLIKSIELPEIRLPFPSKINPHSSEAIAETYRWAVQYSIDAMYTPDKWQKCVDEDTAALACRMYVEASGKELSFVCKLYLWMFCLDDLFDDISNFTSPEKMAPFIMELNLILLWSFPDDPKLRKELVRYLRNFDDKHRETVMGYVDSKLAQARLHPGTVYDLPTGYPPLLDAFRDLWSTLVAEKPAEYCLRWAIPSQRFNNSMALESTIRSADNVPKSVANYMTSRKDSVALDLCMDRCIIVVDPEGCARPLRSNNSQVFMHVSCEYVDMVNLPTDLFETPECRHLLRLVNDVCAWLNDLYSFKKEALMGDSFNMVIVISQERACSLVEAVGMTVEIIHERLKDFPQVVKALELITPPEHREAVFRYIQAAQNSVCAAADWHPLSKRYEA